MKKRNKSPKAKGGGSRAGSTRGGRGGSRGGGKGSREVQVQRQTNSNTKSISTSGYSFLTSKFNTSSNTRRRGGIGGGATANPGPGIKTKDNHINNVIGSNGRIPVVGMNVGEAQAPVPPSSNPTNNNFYLHKKFKKVTSTPVVSADPPNELGSATSSNIDNNPSLNVNSKVLGDTVVANGIDFDNKSDISSQRKISEELSAPTSATTFSGTVAKSVSSSESSSSSSSTSNSSSLVYKPKFRISTDIDAIGTPPAPETSYVSSSSTSSTPISSSTIAPTQFTQSSAPQDGNKGKELPSRVEREQRIDRQSFEDRISKIIDENQSILATWPEHLTKRKGHASKTGQQHQHSPRTNSQVVIMSGGSTTEINSNHNNNINQTLNLSKAHLQLPSTSSRLPCFEIPSDMGYNPNTANININHSPHPVHSSLIFPSSSAMLSGGGPSSSLEAASASDFSDSSVKDLSFANCGSSSTSSMVPKKRRRMSPTPSRLCGGEVSELPVNEGSSANKNYFQDVDMTVRVSNCGPSGAQVTIRTNNQSSGNNSGGTMHQSAVGVGAVDFSRLIDVPLPLSISSSNKNSMFYSPDPFANEKPMSLTIKDDSSSAIDLKVTKSRGKSPRKAKVHSQISLDIGEGGASTLPAVDFSFPGNKMQVEIAKPSVIMSPSPNLPYLPNSSPSPKFSMSPHSDMAAVDHGREVSPDSAEKSPLLLQSSNPNPKRPTFLALKPTNSNVTKLTEPSVLPSPDTPRGNKQYNQLSLNGSAYTYLGFKVSTRSSYTCLFKAQPMFVPQDTDSKLSMYSNWQPRPADPKECDVSLSSNDSRVNGRKSPNIWYTSALGKGCDTLTVSSPVRQAPISSPVDSSKPFPRGTRDALLPVTPVDPEREHPPPSPTQCDPSVRAAALSPSSTTRACTSPEPSSWTNTSSNTTNTSTTSKSAAGPLALVTKSNGFVRSACLSPPSNSCGSNSNSYQHLPSTKGGSGLSLSAAATAASFSESSSADESSSSYTRNPNTLPQNAIGNLSCDQPLSLTINQNRTAIGTNGLPEDNNTNSSSIHSPVVTNRFDNPRVRIMEGGFESNEDYTYVRGRGRGRYVCEACGIRCKKPSMLRKHLKTHTDLRPYTCKLCNFSFKTKGNLTKHQKSKSHHKKCSSLGIHPNSSRSLAMIGPSFSISDTNTTDDNDSDDDDDDNGVDNEDMDSDSNSQGDDGDTRSSPENYNENASFEKEIAQSLLDLSKMPRMPPGSQSEDSSNTNATLESNTNTAPAKSQPLTFSVRAMLEEQSKAKASHPSVSLSSPAPDSLEAPMDLSCKANQPKTVNIGDPVESDMKRAKLEKNGYVRSFGIVGEAQRWEPDEDLMLNGCLNLKKVRNVNTHSATATPLEEKKPSVPIAVAISENASVPISPAPASAPIVPLQVDIKPEVFEFPVENKERLEINKSPPVFIGKRKRDSSVGSTDDSKANVASVVPRPFEPLSVKQDTQRESTPPTATATSAVTSATVSTPVNSNTIPKQQKLHQPWLSSPEAKEKDVDVETVPTPVSVSVTVPSLVPPGQPSPPTATTVIPPKETFSPKAPAPVVIKTSPEREIDVVTNDPVPVASVEPASEVPSPNSKMFPSIVMNKPQAEFRQPSGAQALVKDEGKAECNVCGKSFARASQLTLHMNIHYLERPFRCDPCGVSFRTKGHLIKHRRSSSHDCKVYLTEAWGVANEENPRPFKCPDCKIAFRIHGHLAKHLRSKMHIMRMECLGKLPFGIYFEMEKSGMNLNEIDTTDCDMSLVSLQNLARKIYGENWMERLTAPTEEPV